MKLKEFRVYNFKSILDSTPVEIDPQVTCLIGKNESGKTTLLHALYRTNPVIPTHYSKKDYSALRSYADADKAPIRVECSFEFEKDLWELLKTEVKKEELLKLSKEKGLTHLDTNLIDNLTTLGPHLFKDNTFKYEKSYDLQNEELKFELQINEQEAFNYLIKHDKNVPDNLRDVPDWKSLHDGLTNIKQLDPLRLAFKQKVEKIDTEGLQKYCGELIWPYLPKFLYFDEAFQLKSKVNLTTFQKCRTDPNYKLTDSDETLLALFSLAGIDLDQIMDPKNNEDLMQQLNRACNELTSILKEYWTQNKHLNIKIDVRPGLPEDEENMRDGKTFWGRIEDTVHRIQNVWTERSHGFIWFLSFLIHFEHRKRQKENMILLLDEPGLSLHAHAQKDLLNYFDNSLQNYQLIYSTHSPFLVDSSRLDRIRFVQDKGIESEESLPIEEDGTKLVDFYTANTNTLFPLQYLLGYEIYEALVGGSNFLIVEDVVDQLFLSSFSNQLMNQKSIGLSEKWIIMIGGDSKLRMLMQLHDQKKNFNLSILLNKKSHQLDEDFYNQFKKRQVLYYGQFLEKEPKEEKIVDVEDLIAPQTYLDWINKYKTDPRSEDIKITNLDPTISQIVEALKQYKRSFDRRNIAEWFNKDKALLWKDISEENKKGFEDIFKTLNGFLSSKPEEGPVATRNEENISKTYNDSSQPEEGPVTTLHPKRIFRPTSS